MGRTWHSITATINIKHFLFFLFFLNYRGPQSTMITQIRLQQKGYLIIVVFLVQTLNARVAHLSSYHESTHGGKGKVMIHWTTRATRYKVPCKIRERGRGWSTHGGSAHSYVVWNIKTSKGQWHIISVEREEGIEIPNQIMTINKMSSKIGWKITWGPSRCS